MKRQYYESPVKYFRELLKSNLNNIAYINFGYFFGFNSSGEDYKRKQIICTLVSLPDDVVELPQATSFSAMGDINSTVLVKVLIDGVFVNIQLHESDFSLLKV
jgi:hypothetical protein